MNANAILPGLEYAYTDFPSRNKSYYPGARRVRVTWIYKLDTIYSNRKKTLVEYVFLDEDGEPMKDQYTGELIPIKTTSARHIVATWSDHLIEAERHAVKQAEREAQWKLEEEERRRRIDEQQKERLKQEEERKRKQERMIQYLVDHGFPRSSITINSYEIRIARFNLPEEVITANGKNNAQSEPDQEPSPADYTR